MPWHNKETELNVCEKIEEDMPYAASMKKRKNLIEKP